MKSRKHPKGKYLWTAKVGEKGQIVIPKEAREVFGIAPGDVLILLGDQKRGIAIPTREVMQKMTDILHKESEEEDEE